MAGAFIRLIKDIVNANESWSRSQAQPRQSAPSSSGISAEGAAFRDREVSNMADWSASARARGDHDEARRTELESKLKFGGGLSRDELREYHKRIGH